LRAYSKDDGAYYVLWFLAILVSTGYTYLWDIYKDWGLMEKNRGYLRKSLMYPKNSYYWAMISNLIMRFMWTLTLSEAPLGVNSPYAFATILASVEIFRRAQWNLFRLENEQLNNCGKFRAYNVTVPLPHLQILR